MSEPRSHGQPALPDLGTVLAWPAALTNELLALPDTMRAARVLVDDLGRVTGALADTAQALGNLSQRINGLLDQGEAMLDDVMLPLTTTMGQVNSIESSVTELRNILFTVLKRVPGARRALEEAAPAAKRDGGTETVTDATGRPAPVSRPG